MGHPDLVCVGKAKSNFYVSLFSDYVKFISDIPAWLPENCIIHGQLSLSHRDLLKCNLEDNIIKKLSFLRFKLQTLYP